MLPFNIEYDDDYKLIFNLLTQYNKIDTIYEDLEFTNIYKEEGDNDDKKETHN